MDDILLKRVSLPIITGIPQAQTIDTSNKTKEGSFQDVLLEKLNGKDNEVNFSKHAINRVIQRNINLTNSDLERLNDGVKLAKEKGLDDTLILVDLAAFIVSVKNNTVITTVNNEELKGNVFTNIEGTVII